MFAACELWGWFDKQNLFGIIVFCEGWTDQLCVLPSAQDRGIGTARLEVARSRFPRFGLWTFQRNANACRFYERHDFTLVRETDRRLRQREEGAGCLVRAVVRPVKRTILAVARVNPLPDRCADAC